MGFRLAVDNMGISQYLLSLMSYRVESRIADAICRNQRLTKIGMKFEFKDVLNR